MIRCSNGKITHRFSCSEGKVFNEITKSCDDPKYVNCQKSVTSTSIPSSVTTEMSSADQPIAAKLQSEVSTESASLESNTSTTSPIEVSYQSPASIIASQTGQTPNYINSDNYTTQITLNSNENTSQTPIIGSDVRNSNKTTEPRTVKSETNRISINESFVRYEDDSDSLPINESFVVYERLSLPFNESFVEFDEDLEVTTTTVTPTTPTITTTMATTEMTTSELLTESTTMATSTPTSIRSDVSPVLESVIQNDTLYESTESPEPETTITAKFCALDQNSVGFRMVKSNYSTNETSRLTDYFKVVCYFTNWSRYRSDSAKFMPSNINPFLCTHIIYAFAVLDNNTLTIKSSDECTDIDNKFYEQIISLKEKNPRLKVSIAIGGWVDSEGDKYSRMVNNQTSRTKFIESVVQFINKHKFDGLDLDWEYPKCWQADCQAGPFSDKINFAKLVRELRSAFNRELRPLLLSAAVGASQYIGDNAYEFNSLMINLDFINLMTYDYYTSGSTVAAHHSSLYSHPNAKDQLHSVSNANFSTNYWIRKGVPTYKLILGIPFYGRTFKLMDSKVPEYGAPVNGTGNEGSLTKESGFLAYYEICTNILRKGWAKRVDTYVRKGKPLMTGPYAYDEDQWVGYDDRDHIIQKTDFIKDNGLGGAMVWALDLDDFNGVCCKTKSPLLKTINKELRDYRFDLKFFCP